jgi:ABC-2 type transport system ATP-binding protein
MPNSALQDTKPWDTAVELQGVCKRFKQKQNGDNVLDNLLHPRHKTVDALRDVSLTIHRGEFVAYAGPNGAGKSTTFKLLCGMIGADGGRVRTCGLDPLRQRIPLMRQIGVLFGNRTELWWDHPVLSSFTWKKAVWEIDEETYRRQLDLAVEMLDLGPFLHTFARELSLGQRMRADLGMMLLHRPQFILLDEPTLGLDVLAKRHMIDFLKLLNREQGTTILVTSHDLDDLTEMAKRIVMLSGGRIAFDGAPGDLQRRAGDPRRVTVVCGAAPELSGCTLLESQGDRHTFAFDPGKLPISALLENIARLEGVRDVELSRAPIEGVIAELYQNWREDLP